MLNFMLYLVFIIICIYVQQATTLSIDTSGNVFVHSDLIAVSAVFSLESYSCAKGQKLSEAGGIKDSDSSAAAGTNTNKKITQIKNRVRSANFNGQFTI
jgi:hypothetical protein